MLIDKLCIGGMNIVGSIIVVVIFDYYWMEIGFDLFVFIGCWVCDVIWDWSKVVWICGKFCNGCV